MTKIQKFQTVRDRKKCYGVDKKAIHHEEREETRRKKLGGVWGVF